VKLELLHLCDSLFPVGAFAYSDGLETAAFEQVRLKPDGTDGKRVRLKPDATYETDRDNAPNVVSGFSRTQIAPGSSRTHVTADLGQWMDVVLDENIGRLEGPAVWRAWTMFRDRDWTALVALDEELTALRPAASARRSSRAMGLRLLTTWQALHPDPRLEHALIVAGRGAIGPALPIGFAGACACGGIEQRDAAAAFAYTRLAATVSAAMRLMAIGQTDAHSLLARTLERVPMVVDAIAVRNADPESFTPAMDMAAMSQQYLHSRLFRS
jgi:urease accessory protein